EVGCNHDRIFLYLDWNSLEQAPPVIHNHDPIGDVHDKIHVVLDQNNRRPVAAKRTNAIEKTVDLGGVKTGSRFVNQQYLGFCWQRARKLEHSLLAIRQRPGNSTQTRGHADEMQQLLGAFAAPLLIGLEGRTMCNVLPGRDVVVNMKSRNDIVQNAQLLEQTDLLK